MGASKMAPDYVQWHGFFEVAHRFYFDLLPKARDLSKGDAELTSLIEGIEKSEEHKWKQGLSKEQIEQIQKFYRDRYGQK